MDEKLQDDFPVDWEDDQYVTRREFFKFLTLASGGLAVGSVVVAGVASIPRGKIRFDRAAIASVSEIPIGGYKEFRYPRPQDLCLLVRKSEKEFVAYSRRCTHLSCPVEYQPEQNRLYCPCHNGAFSLEDGHVLQGPPPRPLPQIMLEAVGDQIIATGVKDA